MINDIITGFNKSIDSTDYKWHSTILRSLERSVMNNESVVLIDKSVLGSVINVTLTKDDWALAIAKCERFFDDDTSILNRIAFIKTKVVGNYEESRTELR